MSLRKVAWYIITAAIVWEILQFVVGATVGLYIGAKLMGVV